MGYPPQGVYTQADAGRDIAVHAAVADAHHTEYTDAAALAAAIAGGLSKVIWKDSSETAMSDDNRTATLAMTVLDLTSYTSENAKFAVVRLDMRADVIGTGNDCYLIIRKNGTSPAHQPRLFLDKAGITVAVWHYLVQIVGLDNERKIEYSIDVGTGWTVDSDIRVLGYIE